MPQGFCGMAAVKMHRTGSGMGFRECHLSFPLARWRRESLLFFEQCGKSDSQVRF